LNVVIVKGSESASFFVSPVENISKPADYHIVSPVGNPEPAFGGRVCVGRDREEHYCDDLPPCPGSTTINHLPPWLGSTTVMTCPPAQVALQ
jgi:hypothetical protein